MLRLPEKIESELGNKEATTEPVDFLIDEVEQRHGVIGY